MDGRRHRGAYYVVGTHEVVDTSRPQPRSLLSENEMGYRTTIEAPAMAGQREILARMIVRPERAVCLKGAQLDTATRATTSAPYQTAIPAAAADRDDKYKSRVREAGGNMVQMRLDGAPTAKYHTYYIVPTYYVLCSKYYYY